MKLSAKEKIAKYLATNETRGLTVSQARARFGIQNVSARIEELRKEGIARELVNRIQNIRKDSGFEVTDKIKVQLLKNDSIEQAVLANESYIKSETLTNELIFVSEIKNGTEIEFDELKTIILISK